MRKSLLLRGVISLIALEIGTGEIRAATVAYDGFDSYAPGAQLESGMDGSPGTGLNGGTGFTSPWNIDDPFKTRVTVSTQPLNYSNGQISIQGGTSAVLFGDAADSNQLLSRAFAPQTGMLFFSFLYRTQNPPATSEDFVQVGFSDVTTGEPKASIGSANTAQGNGAPPQFFARVPNAGTSVLSGIVFQKDTNYFLVGKASKTAGSATFNRIDLFVNPTTLLEPAATSATSTAAAGSGVGTFANLIVRTARQDAGDAYFVDELRIGTTYLDVIPEPGAATMLMAAGGCVLGCRRRS